MLNILEDYIFRSLPEQGSFETSPGLLKKVDASGAILPFCGNTAVFLLEDADKKRLAQLQGELYAAAPDMLAQPLSPDTFHVTLHDLVNGAPDRWNLREDMAVAAEKASPILDLCRELPPLHMQATWMFNMVSTSVVLGLKPADGESWRRLDAMYGALETVCPLGYALTPHITLAYYRPGRYEQEKTARLRSALRPVDLEIELRTDRLVLQNFLSMNQYTDA